MKTSYFTFGQSHVHRINGQLYDKDIVVKITATEPRELMVKHFGERWAMEYDKCPDLSLFPRGVFFV